MSSQRLQLPARRRRPPLGHEDVYTRYLPEIERRLGESRIAGGLVREMIEHHLEAGGKRMRALLPVWVCANLGGAPEEALDIGVGLELLHNATLVHDDLQDGDTHRRGRPTVWYKWGMPQAINAGDAIIFEAFASIARAPAGPRVVPMVALAALRVVEGQARDLQLQLDESARWESLPTLAEWEDMARGKTGALFALCMRAGAAAAGASHALLEQAARYGDDVGLLFQVQDDLLDLVGNKGRERCGADLIEGKLSFPVVWALEHASPAEVAPIRAVLGRPRRERTWPMADEAIAALGQCGALEATVAYLKQAWSAAELHPLSEIVPGLVALCLLPVAHVLGQTSVAEEQQAASV